MSIRTLLSVVLRHHPVTPYSWALSRVKYLFSSTLIYYSHYLLRIPAQEEYVEKGGGSRFVLRTGIPLLLVFS